MSVIRVIKNENFTAMSNVHLRDKKLSLKAKGLLSLVLSLPDYWHYSIKGLATICKESSDCIGTTLKELEKGGYLKRERIRNEQGHLKDTEYVFYEVPETPKREKPDQDNPDQAFPILENPEQARPDLENTARINTERVNTEENKDRSIPFPSDAKREETEAYLDLIKQNVDYESLLTVYPDDRDLIDSMIDIIHETVVSEAPMIRVAKAEYPKDLVKGKLLKLNFRHLEFVLEGIKENTTKVKHMRQYLLAALFNAPSTMAPYYRAAVNHDMHKYGKT